jgi:hypothetical protein
MGLLHRTQDDEEQAEGAASESDQAGYKPPREVLLQAQIRRIAEVKRPSMYDFFLSIPVVEFLPCI